MQLSARDAPLRGLPDAAQDRFHQAASRDDHHRVHQRQRLLLRFPLYQQALERHQNKRPLYVLPDFLVTGNQGRLMFALGSIFGLIYSQGTFFYYQPADPLSNAVKLANGLANAINAFTEREELVAEVTERVNAQIARLGLREAITVLSSYYTTASGNHNTSLDEPLRELKRLVRDYTDNLRSIDAFSAGIQIPVRRA
jgi:hypothetical protein